MSEEPLGADEVSAIAEEAYIYAFPILMGYRSRTCCVSTSSLWGAERDERFVGT
jgi:hypothetical protein